MPTERLTTKDKRLIAEHLNHFVQDGGESVISMNDFKRAMMWSNNYSLQEIADEEGVTMQTVANGVKKVVARVKAWRGDE